MAGPCSILMDFDYTKAKLWRIRPFSSYFCSLLLRQDSIVLQQDSIVLQQDSIVLRQDSIVLRQDSIVLRQDSIVVWEDSTVVWEDSTVVWEDSIVVWEENCVRKIAVSPDEKYSCQVWKFVIHVFSPRKIKKQSVKHFFVVSAFSRRGLFFFLRKSVFSKMVILKL